MINHSNRAYSTFIMTLKNKNLMHLKDKKSINIVYSDNVHYKHAKNTRKHALKETILQNINQT